MSFTAKNRLPALIQTLKLVKSPDRHRRIMKPIALDSGQKLLALYRQNAPVGERWTEPSYESPAGRTIVHGRPSQRIHGMTLDASWLPVEINDQPGQVSFGIGTATREAEVLLAGAMGHTIPVSGRITFWHIKSGMAMFFGGHGEYPEVYHPGFKRNPFVSQAWYRGGRKLVESNFVQGTRQIRSLIYDFFEERI